MKVPWDRIGIITGIALAGLSIIKWADHNANIIGTFLAILAVALFLLIILIKIIAKGRSLAFRLNRVIDYLESLRHCHNFCGANTKRFCFPSNECPEFTIIKGRDEILKLGVEILRKVNPDDKVIFMTNHLDVDQSMITELVEKAKIAKLRIIHSKPVTDLWKGHWDSLTANADIFKIDNENIRLLAIEGREGYICNSTSKRTGGQADMYCGIYSDKMPYISMMEKVFNFHCQDKNIIS